MKDQVHSFLSHLGDAAVIGIPALLGGVVDYANQIYNGTKNWGWGGFVVHLVSAVFFGMVCGWSAQAYSTAEQLNTAHYLVSASSAMGGFLGVRVADLITWRFLKTERRKK